MRALSAPNMIVCILINVCRLACSVFRSALKSNSGTLWVPLSRFSRGARETRRSRSHRKNELLAGLISDFTLARRRHREAQPYETKLNHTGPTPQHHTSGPVSETHSTSGTSSLDIILYCQAQPLLMQVPSQSGGPHKGGRQT